MARRTLGILAQSLQYTNRLDEAEQTVWKAFARKIDTTDFHLRLHTIAYLRGDAAAMQREMEWVRQKAERSYYARQVSVAACAGRLREAEALQKRVDAINERDRLTEAVADARATWSFRMAVVGQSKKAVALADSAAPSPGAWGECLTTYALVGDQARVARLLSQMIAHPPAGDSKLDAEPFAALLNGALLFERGKPDEALQALQTAARYGAHRYNLLPQYLRGYALIAAKRPVEAAVEFQKAIAFRTISPFTLTWELAYVGLARAYAAAGDKAASRKAYEDFFALWKDADPDLPILIEAKKEYAALK